MYNFVGVKKDGGETVLACGYTSRGHCFASATKVAIDAAATGNPDRLLRISIRDESNNILPEYENSPHLNIRQ